MNQNELYHHGIRGMKWGVRRYQNADGSLTKAGKKRYLTEENFERVQAAKANARYAKARRKEDAKTQAEIDKINTKAEKAASRGKDPEKVKEKSFKNMSNEELQNVTYRMNLENNYLNAKRNLANATPKEVNKGVEFIKSIGNDIILPAAKSVGRNYLESTLKDKLGLSSSDVNEAARKRVEAKRLRKEERDLDSYEENRAANENSATRQRAAKDSTSAKVFAQNYDWFKNNHPEMFSTSKSSESSDFDFTKSDSKSSNDFYQYQDTGMKYLTNNVLLLEDKQR